jgi:hypothetical protein
MEVVLDSGAAKLSVISKTEPPRALLARPPFSFAGLIDKDFAEANAIAERFTRAKK